MKKTILASLLMIALAITTTTNAQVGIGVSTANINPSAQLDVSSTTKGFLPPRMTEVQKIAISSPASGLLVYQTDGASGYYYYDGSIWKQGLGPQGAAGAAGASGQTNTSLLYSSSAIYADGAAPTDAPSSVTSNGNFGWYFKNTSSGSSRKINWYIQPKSSSMKVSDLTGLYLELFNVAITSASNMPFIIVYTKPTGLGDAASWYKSRRFYTFSGSPTANTKYLGFANLGAASPNTYNTSLLDLVAGTTTGTFASTEDILFISIASNSASPAGACEFVANKFGIITGTSTQEFLFMPPSSIANLSGYATTSSLDAEVSRAQSAEATLTSSLATKATTNELNTEVSRAQSAETSLTSSLATKAPIASPSFTGAVTVGGASSTTSAAVEVSSTTQGFLPPRMTGAQRDAIANPAQGLMLYCTDCGSNGEPEYYNGAAWVNLMGGATAAPITIGSAFLGGILFYILQPGDPGYDPNTFHGLIAASSDQSNGIVWSNNTNTLIGGSTSNAFALGTGMANTTAIVNQSGAGTCAASICQAYNGGSYTQWYLPSADELNLMYTNIGQGAVSNIGGFAADYYWSSTESLSGSLSYFVNFSDSNMFYTGKYNTFHVRAIRSF